MRSLSPEAQGPWPPPEASVERSPPETPSLAPRPGFRVLFHASLAAVRCRPVQHGVVYRLRDHSLCDYVEVDALPLEDPPDRLEGGPTARRGEQQHLTPLELVVPERRLVGWRFYVDEDGRDPHPGEDRDGQKGGYRDKEQEEDNPDLGRREREEESRDHEDRGETCCNPEAPGVVRDQYVARPFRERLRHVGVRTFQNSGEVLVPDSDLAQLRDSLVEPGTIFQDADHRIPGPFPGCDPWRLTQSSTSSARAFSAFPRNLGKSLTHCATLCWGGNVFL